MKDRGSEEAIIAASVGRILTGRAETGEMRLSYREVDRIETSSQNPNLIRRATGSVCHSPYEL